MKLAPCVSVVVAYVAACGGGDGGGPPATLTRIGIDPASVTLNVGETRQLTAAGTGSDGKPFALGSPAWQSSNGGVVTVEAGGGSTRTITAVGGGTATVSLTVAGVTGSASVTVNAVQPQRFTLSVTKTGSGAGDVGSVPAGIACGTTCSAIYTSGTQVELVATPAAGSTFAGWSGGCGGTASSCAVTLNADKNVVATFNQTQPQNVTLSVTASGPGAVSVNPGGNCSQSTCPFAVQSGASVTLSAQPHQNATFSGWSGACTGSNATCTLTLTSNQSVTATFTAVAPTFTLVVNKVGLGSVSSDPLGISCGSQCTAPFAQGISVVLNASPDSSSDFGGWTGACTGTNTSCTVTMSSSQTVTATFVARLTLSVSIAGGTGNVRVDPGGSTCSTSSACTTSHVSGATVTLTPTPGANHQFGSWGGDCAGTASGPCTLTMSQDRTVSVSFTPTFILSVTVAGSGTVGESGGGAFSCSSGTCTASYPSGAAVTLTATQAQDFDFTGWSGDCTATSGTCTVTMTQNRAITATFVRTFALSVSVTGSGSVVSDPAGLACSSGTCTARFRTGPAIGFTATASGTSAVFTGWSGACSGTGSCSVTPSADLTVSANFLSYTVSLAESELSMVPGETRSLSVTVTRTSGEAAPVSVSVSTPPAGAIASIDPSSVSPTANASLSLTTPLSMPLGTTPLTVTAAFGVFTREQQFNLTVRSPTRLSAPSGIALEAGGTTALVTEADRLVRVRIADRVVTKTIASGLPSPREVALEAGGASALVTTASHTVVRVALASGVKTTLVPAGLVEPSGIAIEASGTTALVTDHGGTGGTGRVVRVDLISGQVAPITPAALGLGTLRSIAIETSGTSALVAEDGGRRLLRVNLSSGGVTALATQLITAAGPRGLAIEPGGATALVAGSAQLVRVALATGVITPVFSVWALDNPGLHALALPVAGDFVLAVDRNTGRLLRIPTTSPVTALAPARQSLEAFADPYGVAIEAGGTTALVTDCGPSTVFPCNDGRVLRVDLTTGVLTRVTPASHALAQVRGLALESGGTTALLTEVASPSARLLRVTLATGAVTPLATGFSMPFDVALEAGGTTALLVDNTTLRRVTLANGATAPIATPGSFLGAVAVESGGGTALVLDDASPGRLARVTLSNGAVATVANGFAPQSLQSAPSGLAIESGGTSAIVVEHGHSGRVLRVDLAAGTFRVLAANLGNPLRAALEPSGGSALVTVGFVDGNLATQLKLYRVALSGFPQPSSLGQALNHPTGVALESGGTSALMLDWGSSNPNETSGRLVRVDLTNGMRTVVGTGLHHPQGLALEASGAALVSDFAGRIVRVATNGNISLVATGLNQPEGLAIAPGGASVLVAERGPGRVVEVDLSDGSFSVVAASLPNVRQVIVEASGETALVAHDGGLSRIDLVFGEVTPLTGWNVHSFAVEPGGQTAVVVGFASSGGNGRANADGLARIDLMTGAVTVLTPPLFVDPHTLILESSGTTALITEHRPHSGTLFRIPVPAP